MFWVLRAVAIVITNLFKSRGRLEAENLLLRHQLNVALRQVPGRLRLCGSDRAILVGMFRLSLPKISSGGGSAQRGKIRGGRRQ
jgi:hypothetical protein